MIRTVSPQENGVTVFNQQLTMSSREIAELTDKRHPDVKRDIVNMFEQLKEDASIFAHIYLDAMNRKQTEYLLTREYVECLLTGYNAELRMKVIKRLRELESNINKPQFSIPQSLPEALRLAADLADENQLLSSKVTELSPKAEFHDKVTVSHGAVSLAQAAKILNTGRNRLCSQLRQIGWLRRNNEPYQDKIEQGLLDVKITNWERPDSGIQQSVTALVTGKGLTKLSKLINLH